MQIEYTASGFQHAADRLEQLEEIKKNIEGTNREEERTLYIKYYELQEELDKKKREEEQVMNEIHKERLQPTINERNQLMDYRKEVQRIIHLIGKNYDVEKIEPAAYFTGYGIGLHNALMQEQLIRKPFAALDVVVVENDRPSNKFTVAIVGQFAFNSMRGASARIYTTKWKSYNTTVPLAYEPSLKCAIQWYEKNLKTTWNTKAKIIRELIEHIKEEEARYEEHLNLKKKYNVLDFAPLIDSRCIVCKKELYLVGEVSEGFTDRHPNCTWCGAKLAKPALDIQNATNETEPIATAEVIP